MAEINQKIYKCDICGTKSPDPLRSSFFLSRIMSKAIGRWDIIRRTALGSLAATYATNVARR